MNTVTSCVSLPPRRTGNENDSASHLTTDMTAAKVRHRAVQAIVFGVLAAAGWVLILLKFHRENYVVWGPGVGLPGCDRAARVIRRARPAPRLAAVRGTQEDQRPRSGRRGQERLQQHADLGEPQSHLGAKPGIVGVPDDAVPVAQARRGGEGAWIVLDLVLHP
jgi:hypothetical protein